MATSKTLACVSAQYDDNGKRVHIFATHVDYQQLSKAVKTMFAFIGEVPASDEIVLDFSTWNHSSLAEPEVVQQEIYSIINAAAFPRTIRHIVVAVSGPGRDPGLSDMQHFTYEPSENGYQEVEFFRGVHPMMAERLHLWRLKFQDRTAAVS